MSLNFRVRPTMRVLTNADFLGAGAISSATRAKLSSKLFPEPDMIRSSTKAERVNCGVRISHTSTFKDLSEARAVAHRFHFIDRMETRERFHVATPEESSVTTEFLVMFEEGQSRDYFSISTYDSDGMIAATETFVYNDEGKIVSYPFTDSLVSPFLVKEARLEEVSAWDGTRMLKFELALEELDRDIELALLWESIGSIERHTVTCSPGNTVAAIHMSLEGNATAYPCDWVAIAVDAKERVLAQAHFALEVN